MAEIPNHQKAKPNKTIKFQTIYAKSQQFSSVFNPIGFNFPSLE